MKISIIATVDRNNGLAEEGAFPWHLPVDLQCFKRTTNGSPLLMGRKAFEMLGGPRIAGPKDIILSFGMPGNTNSTKVFQELSEALSYLRAQDTDQVFLIGGKKIFDLGISVCENIYLTRIYTSFPGGGSTFPEINNLMWTAISRKDTRRSKDNPFDSSFFQYERNIPTPGPSLS